MVKMDNVVKDLVERVVGYPITEETEQEVVHKYYILGFKHMTFLVERDFLGSSINLVGEGAFLDHPTHVIPDIILEYIHEGHEVYIYPCEKCRREQKVRKPLILDGEHVEINGQLVEYEEYVSTEYVGKSMVVILPIEGGEKRVHYCSRPNSDHNYIETIKG